MKESYLEKKLREAIELRGGVSYKFVSPNNAGVQDRLNCLPYAVVHFVETKVNGNTLSKLQEYQAERLTQRGHQVFAVVDEDSLYLYLDYVDHEQAALKELDLIFQNLDLL